MARLVLGEGNKGVLSLCISVISIIRGNMDLINIKGTNAL